MSYETIRVEAADGIVRLTLDRPDSANAITATMAEELLDAARRCQGGNVRAVVLTGAGRFFSAGGDIAAFAVCGDELPAALDSMTADLHAALAALAAIDAPLIAAVNGTAAGAGLSLVCAADIAIASRSARFKSAYTAAGLTPDGGATYFLSRLVGLRRAQELVLMNRTLTAAEAAQWGLVTRVVDDDDLESEVATVASAIAAGATGALGAAKRLLHAGWTASLEAQMASESRAIAAAAGTAEGREGIAAFVAGRAADFRRAGVV